MVGYVGLRSDYESAAASLPAELERAKKNGIPTTAAEMAGVPPPGATDATELVHEFETAFNEADRAIKDQFGPRTSHMEMARFAQENGTGNMASLRRMLDKHKRSLELATSIANQKHFFIDRDWKKPWLTNFFELSQLKNACYVLCSRGHYKAKTSDFGGALADHNLARNVAQHALANRTYIGALVHIALRAIILRSYESLISMQADNAENLKRIERDIESWPESIDLIPVLKGEAYFNFKTFSHLKEATKDAKEQSAEFGMSDEKSFPEWVKFPPSIPIETVQNAYAATSLRVWNDEFESLQKDDSLGQLVDRLAKTYIKMSQSQRMTEKLVGTESGAVLRVDEITQKDSLSLKLHKALLKCMLFRTRNGRFPKDLGEVGLEIPDSNGKGNVKYIATQSSCKIYSVGEDGKDDGGERNMKDHPQASFPAFSWQTPPAGKRVSPRRVAQP